MYNHLHVFNHFFQSISYLRFAFPLDADARVTVSNIYIYAYIYVMNVSVAVTQEGINGHLWEQIVM